MIINLDTNFEQVLQSKENIRTQNKVVIDEANSIEYGFWDFLQTTGETLLDAVGTTVPPLSIAAGVAAITGKLMQDAGFSYTNTIEIIYK